MQQDVIADRYARALLAVATEQNKAEAVLGQVEWYQKTAAVSCSSFFENPNIPHEAKENLVKKLFCPTEGKETEPVLKILIPLVRLLLRKNRIRYLRDVFRLYSKRYAEQKGVVTAKLYVVHPMEQTVVDRLKAKLSDRFGGRTVAFDVIQDPAILGGFIVTTETEQLDASLKRALANLGERLKTAPVG